MVDMFHTMVSRDVILSLLSNFFTCVAILIIISMCLWPFWLSHFLLISQRQLDGVGISAPQVNKDLRMFISALSDDPESVANAEQTSGSASSSDPAFEMFINPKLLDKSIEMNLDWEGCLSFPGLYGKVNRCSEIRVEYINVHGDVCRRSLSGFAARVFQHEHDHLDGINFVDRITDKRNIVKEEELEKILMQEEELRKQQEEKK